jgi:hypothetical protein
MLQKSKFCRECDERRLFAKSHFSGGMGCLLTILTAGLFIPIWLLIGLCETLSAWRCQDCGSRG